MRGVAGAPRDQPDARGAAEPARAEQRLSCAPSWPTGTTTAGRCDCRRTSTARRSPCTRCPRLGRRHLQRPQPRPAAGAAGGGLRPAGTSCCSSAQTIRSTSSWRTCTPLSVAAVSESVRADGAVDFDACRDRMLATFGTPASRAKAAAKAAAAPPPSSSAAAAPAAADASAAASSSSRRSSRRPPTRRPPTASASRRSRRSRSRRRRTRGRRAPA